MKKSKTLTKDVKGCKLIPIRPSPSNDQLDPCHFKKQQNSDKNAATNLQRKPRASTSETKHSFVQPISISTNNDLNKNFAKVKLKTASQKLVKKYPERFYSSERYSPAEGSSCTTINTRSTSLNLPKLLNKTNVAPIKVKVSQPKVVADKQINEKATVKVNKINHVEHIPTRSSAVATVPVEIISAQNRINNIHNNINTTMTTNYKHLSLTEQKKLQWEKEKEEMHGLWSPWGRPPNSVSVPQALNDIGYIRLDHLKNDISSNYAYINKLPSPQSYNEYHLPPILIENAQQIKKATMKPSQYHQITITTPNNSIKNDYNSNQEQHYVNRLPLPPNTNKVHPLQPNEANYNYYNNEYHQEQQQRMMSTGGSSRYPYDNRHFEINDDNYTSGYQSNQSESNGFTSRQNSGSGNNDINNRLTSRENYFNNNGGTETMPTSRALPLPAHAMRSSFEIGTGVSDSGYIEEIQEKEKAQWLHDLKLQMEEQKQKKDLEAKRGQWGDKGVCVGQFWEPSSDINSRLPNSAARAQQCGTPTWAKEKSQTYRPQTSQSQPCLVDPRVYNEYNIGQPHFQQNPQVFYMNQSAVDLRNVPGLSNPQIESTFLRGQNVPVDPETMQEKEKKRIVALQNQQAILKQIEERQQKLKEEQEQRRRQDRLDEQRIREQQLKLLERAEMEKRLKEQQIRDENYELSHVDYSPPIKPKINENERNPHFPHPNSNQKRQLYHHQVQNSNEIIDYFQEKNLANECVQTESNGIDECVNCRSPRKKSSTPPSSSNREFGTQTEFTEATNAKNSKTSTGKSSKRTINSSTPEQKEQNLKNKTLDADESKTGGGSIKKEKPRWGATPVKKPYVKQSEKDPVYQEKLNKINKKKNWAKEKAEERVHAAAAEVDTATESDDNRKFNNPHTSQNGSNYGRQQGINKLKAGSGPAVKNKKASVIESAIQKQQEQWIKQQELEKRQLSYSDTPQFEIPEIRFTFDDRNQDDYYDDESQQTNGYEIRHDKMKKIQSGSGLEKSSNVKTSQHNVKSSKASGIPVKYKKQNTKFLAESEETSPGFSTTANDDTTLDLERNQNEDTNAMQHKPAPARKKINNKNKSTTSQNVKNNKISKSQKSTRKLTPENSPRIDSNPILTRVQSPPVPALMRKIQLGVDPEEFGNAANLSYELPDQVNVDSTPPIQTPITPTIILPPEIQSEPLKPGSAKVQQQANIISTQDKQSARSQSRGKNEIRQNIVKRSSHHEQQHQRHHRQALSTVPDQEDEEAEEEESNDQVPSSATYNDQTSSSNTTSSDSKPTTHEMEYSNYYTPPSIIISPRSQFKNNYYLDTYVGQLSGRASTTDTELSQRRTFIDSVLSHDEVKEQISARENELSQKGIIEFSIHLPHGYNPSNAPSIIVSTKYSDDEDEKIIHVSQPSSISPQSTQEQISQLEHEYHNLNEYKDPFEAERQRATINWLYSNDHRQTQAASLQRTPYLLTHLASLKKGIEREQLDLDTIPLKNFYYHDYRSTHIQRRNDDDDDDDPALFDY